MLFIDRLNFFSFIKVLKSRYKKIHFLSNNGFLTISLIRLLNIFGYKCVIDNFFYGEIFSDSGESMYLKTRKDASKMAFEYSEIVVDKLTDNCLINQKDELPLKSFISKDFFL